MLEQTKRIPVSFRISSVLSMVKPEPNLHTGSDRLRLRNTASKIEKSEMWIFFFYRSDIFLNFFKALITGTTKQNFYNFVIFSCRSCQQGFAAISHAELDKIGKPERVVFFNETLLRIMIFSRQRYIPA